MRTIVRACVLGLGLLSFHSGLFSQQVAKTIPCAASPDGLIGFLEFRPSDYGSQKHPLIIFLHGIGERGNGTSQINSVAANGTPNLCANGASMRFTVGGQTSSFVVLSPQLSSQYGYWPTYYVKQMIAYAKANLQIDPNRIYVTGLSLGGGGVWRLITDTENFDHTFDGTIAAAAPVCGTQEETDADFCSTIGTNHLPVWAFHSMDDGTVGVGATQHAEILGNMCGNFSPAMKFTYYQSGGHNGAWIHAYDTGHITTPVNGGGNFTANPNMYEWFLSNSRSGGAQTNYTAPVANAGAAQIITLPLSLITLTGSGTGTNGATISSYSWTKTSGPAAGTISLPLLNTTLVIGLVQGTYVFTLKVTDNHGLSSSSNVTITVNGAATNQYPVSNPGANISVTLPTNNIVLDGTSSYDPDGYLTTYRWTQTAGPTGPVMANRSAATTAVNGLLAGTYTFVLQVTDNGGLVGSSSVTVTVNNAALTAGRPTNQYPVSNPGANISVILPTNNIVLDGTASYDPDGYLTAYWWTQTAGPIGPVMANRSAGTTAVNGLLAGTYTFVLQVTDNGGLVGAASVTVTVNAAATNQYPVTNPGANITVTLPTNNIVLDGTSSYDPDGYLTTYRWTQTAGPIGPVMANRSAATTAVNGLLAGTYTYVLQVTDNGGLVGAASMTVTVNPAGANQYPVANPGTNITVTLPTSNIVLNGTTSYDPDGYLTAYRWTQTAGPIGPAMANRSAATTAVNGLLAGTYTYVLQVTDNGGLVGAASMTVTVNPASSTANQPIGYIKQTVGLWQACDDASSDGRIPIYSNGIANGNLVYLDAGLTNIFNGGYNWFSFTPVLGGPVTQGLSVFPDGVIHLLSACAGNTTPPPVTAPASNLLGYIKMSVGPYQACDDASSGSRIPIYGTSIANGSYVYADAAMTQKYDGGWNWFSFTPVLGGSVTAAFAIYPIGSIGLLTNCSAGSRVAATTPAQAGLVQGADAVPAAAFKLNIYPNPVRNSATIQLNSTENGAKTISLYNAGGVLTSKYTWQTVKGNNTFSLNNISGLPAGLYIADIRDSNGKPVGKVKFVKQ